MKTHTNIKKVAFLIGLTASIVTIFVWLSGKSSISELFFSDRQRDKTTPSSTITESILTERTPVPAKENDKQEAINYRFPNTPIFSSVTDYEDLALDRCESAYFWEKPERFAFGPDETGKTTVLDTLLNELPSGSIVFLKPGRYRVTKKVKPDLLLIGENRDQTQIYFSDLGFPIGDDGDDMISGFVNLTLIWPDPTIKETDAMSAACILNRGDFAHYCVIASIGGGMAVTLLIRQ